MDNENAITLTLPNAEILELIAKLAVSRVNGVEAETHDAHIKIGHRTTAITFTPVERGLEDESDGGNSPARTP